MEEIKQLFTAKGDQRIKLKQAYRFCFCCWRMFQLEMAEPPQDVKDLFNNSYSDNGVMTVENLHKFLIDFQGEECTLENVQNIFNSLTHLHIFQRRGLQLDDFFRYLLGDLNPPLASHGLSSNCSIEPIIKALRSGVKVIELDLWPNKDQNEIEVRHGGTMTSPVKLIRCLEAIKENAFYASEYPVIITFEDHLKPFLQAKRKILISTKPPKEFDGFKEQEHEQKIKELTDLKILGNDTEPRNHDELEIQIKDDNEEEDDEESATPEYKHLIAIHALKWKKGLANLLKDESRRVARLSINEEKLKNVVKTHSADLVRFTQKNLLRIYPKGTRILSSNYNPMIAWTHGAQMVAFNMQGYGKHLWIMQGMFRANGGCGYVKKPDFLLSDEPFDPNIKRQVKKVLKVKLYMGNGWHLEFRRTHFDPCSPPDFFTKIEILGVPADTKKKSTLPLEDQWVPMWNKEFEFPLTAPELALLRLEVCEHDVDRRHGFGGQTCLPVSELRRGIRAVPLYNKKGQKYDHVKLLMQFQLLSVNSL
ncbi:Phosphoinositide phospholipase C 2 [Bienertia sinuspersici]